MIRLLVCFLTFSLFQQVKAQVNIGILKGKRDFEIESIVKGDSVSLVFSKPTQSNIIESELFWITEKGISKPMSIKRRSDESFSGITYNSGSYYLFFKTSKKHKDALNVYKSDGFNFDTPATTIPLDGKVLGTYGGYDICVVTLEKKSGILKVLTFNESKLISEKIIKIPFRLNTLQDAEIKFLDMDSDITLGQSFARAKFLKKGNIISLVLDEPKIDYEENQNAPFKTSVFRYNLETDKTDIKVFFESTNSSFRSFLIDDYLFKASHTVKGTWLSVFDIALNKKIIDQDLLSKEDEDKTRGYHRNGRDFTLKEDLLKIPHVPIGSSNEWSPVVIVEKAASDYVVTIGTYSDSKGAFVIGGSPLLLVASFVVTAAMQGKEKPSMSSYTYLSGDPTKAISYSRSLKYYKKSIDDYESSFIPDHFYFKGYVASPRLSWGLYGVNGASDLNVVLFRKEDIQD